MHATTILGVALIAAALLLGLPGTSSPENAPPHPERDERLERLDEGMMDVTRLRFAAIFGANEQDDEEVERLSERLKDLQKQRFAMLRATGRM
jgi:hypothetical protein